jgi:transcriptional regulator with XRE-family HTH domain
MIMGLSERIKTLRQAKQLSQAKLAEVLGLTKGAVNSWEAGSSQPSLLCVMKLAGFFGVTTDYLLGLNERRLINADGLTEQEINHITAVVEDLRNK